MSFGRLEKLLGNSQRIVISSSKSEQERVDALKGGYDERIINRRKQLIYGIGIGKIEGSELASDSPSDMWRTARPL